MDNVLEKFAAAVLFDGFRDELEKIAAANWRALLAAGTKSGATPEASQIANKLVAGGASKSFGGRSMSWPRSEKIFGRSTGLERAPGRVAAAQGEITAAKARPGVYGNISGHEAWLRNVKQSPHLDRWSRDAPVNLPG